MDTDQAHSRSWFVQVYAFTCLKVDRPLLVSTPPPWYMNFDYLINDLRVNSIPQGIRLSNFLLGLEPNLLLMTRLYRSMMLEINEHSCCYKNLKLQNRCVFLLRYRAFQKCALKKIHIQITPIIKYYKYRFIYISLFSKILFSILLLISLILFTLLCIYERLICLQRVNNSYSLL